MSLFARRTAVLLKAESTYGTDPTPSGSANAVLATDVTLTPIDAQYQAKPELRGAYMGTELEIPTAAPVRLTFGVHLTGSGAAGTAPAYGPLLLALGLSETVNSGTSVVYAPESAHADHGSVTAKVYLDGKLHALTGARGTGRFQLDANGLPMLSVDLTGLYVAPSDAALPALTTTAWKTPLPVSAANTTLTLFGTEVVGVAFSLDIGNTVTHRDLIGQEDVVITDRRSSGATTFEATLVATEAWEAHVKAADLDAMQLVHGTTAGAIVQFDAPAV